MSFARKWRNKEALEKEIVLQFMKDYAQAILHGGREIGGVNVIEKILTSSRRLSSELNHGVIVTKTTFWSGSSREIFQNGTKPT